MTVKIVDSREARANWRDVLDMAQTNDTDVIITRYNKPVVAVVAYEDYIAVQDELRKRRATRRVQRRLEAEAGATMIASERVLAKEWDTPEEDEAWANL
jgi:prevent-host-death family protein